MKHEIEQACHYILECETMPSLAEVAAHVGLSPTRLQKSFKQALGVSPRGFADARRLERLKTALRQGEPISGALYEAGYGSPSRLYEFADRYLGMTPRTYQAGGLASTIQYSIVPCRLGQLLVAATPRGICAVRIGVNRDRLKAELAAEFHAADLVEADAELHAWVQALIDYLSGEAPWPLLPYDIRATAFQRRVWEWLRTVPPGQTYNYSEAAALLGMPKATRALASACARNPVALVIPCHRIVPKAGGVGGYRWGPQRKQTLLELEGAVPPSGRATGAG